VRIAWILLGVAMLAWLSFEDQSVRWVLFFAALVCGLAAYSLALRWRLTAGRRAYYLPLLGAAAGLAVILVALFLMALKSGLHGHMSPDFSPDQIVWVVSRTLNWGIAGLLAGCAAFMCPVIRAKRP
jgi:hypothetical protein